MVQGISIPASDAEDMRAVELAELEDYQRAVGGWIEAVDIPDLGVTMYVDEEGLTCGCHATGAPYSCGGFAFHSLATHISAAMSLVGLTEDTGSLFPL